MALIIVGDFDTEKTKPMIQETFSRLVPKELPERPSYPEVSFAGNPKKHYNLGYNAMVTWVYQGVKEGDPDQDVLDFVCALLYNGKVGLLDKVNTKGDVQFAGVYSDARRNTGRLIIEAVPYFDANQAQFESDDATKTIVMREVDKIKNGQISDELIASVKSMYAQAEKLEEESRSAKMNHLMDAFTYGKPLDDIFTQNEKIQALTKDEIVRVAKTHHLKVRISGAADSATGNEQINNSLSRKRADYIKTLMVQRGIDESLVKTSYEGGINEYYPVQANRQTCVTLSF